MLLSPDCNPETVTDCDGRTLRELCKSCSRSPERKKKASPYAISLLQVHWLQTAGFRFDNDSFDLQFWLDLALVKHRVRAAGQAS